MKLAPPPTKDDVVVWQGQYFIGTEFQTGTYEFNFTVYDATEDGNICYSNKTELTTGNWGEWKTEQFGVSASCNNVSKDYFLEIKIDNEIQEERKRLTMFNFLRKDVNETTEGTIGAKRLLELDDTMVFNRILYGEELAKQQLAAKEYLALVKIKTQKNISDLAYGESYALRVQRLRSAGEFAKAKIESERRIVLAELNESKKLAKLRRILYEGYDPETEAEIEQVAAEKVAAVEQLAAEKTILVEQELNASIAALEDRGTRYILIDTDGTLKKAEEEEEEVGDISATGTINANSFSTGDGNLKWKIFTGTLDSDSTTTFEHGIPLVKLAGANCVLHGGDQLFSLYDAGADLTVAERQYAYLIYVNGNNFVIDKVGANLQGNAYRCTIWYLS